MSRGGLLRTWLGGLLMLGAIGNTVWVLSRSKEQTLTCADVVRQFKAEHAAIYEAAGSPTVHCEHRKGAAGYSGVTNHIDINLDLTAEARAAHLVDRRAYWRELVAHEVGHAWARHHGLDDRWPTYQKIRGLPLSVDPKVPQEDYAETFAASLGMFTGFGPPPYAFQTPAGKPTQNQIERLRSAHLLPR